MPKENYVPTLFDITSESDETTWTACLKSRRKSLEDEGINVEDSKLFLESRVNSKLSLTTALFGANRISGSL